MANAEYRPDEAAIIIRLDDGENAVLAAEWAKARNDDDRANFAPMVAVGQFVAGRIDVYRAAAVLDTAARLAKLPAEKQAQILAAIAGE